MSQVPIISRKMFLWDMLHMINVITGLKSRGRCLKHTFFGQMDTLSSLSSMPGMITVIFLGPLNPSTFVSCNTRAKLYSRLFVSVCYRSVCWVHTVILDSHNKWPPALPAVTHTLWQKAFSQGFHLRHKLWTLCPEHWTWNKTTDAQRAKPSNTSESVNTARVWGHTPKGPT